MVSKHNRSVRVHEPYAKLTLQGAEAGWSAPHNAALLTGRTAQSGRWSVRQASLARYHAGLGRQLRALRFRRVSRGPASSRAASHRHIAARVNAVSVPGANNREKMVAPRAGFEPATNRLTAGCSTAELPGKRPIAHIAIAGTRITKVSRLAKSKWSREGPRASAGCRQGRPRRGLQERKRAYARARATSGATAWQPGSEVVLAVHHRARNFLALEAAEGELSVGQAGEHVVAMGHGAREPDAVEEFGYGAEETGAAPRRRVGEGVRTHLRIPYGLLALK